MTSSLHFKYIVVCTFMCIFWQVSIFMTHISNYGNDRLALFLFEHAINFIQKWTNIQLVTEPPLKLAEVYFNLYPSEKLPLWTVSMQIIFVQLFSAAYLLLISSVCLFYPWTYQNWHNTKCTQRIITTKSWKICTPWKSIYCAVHTFINS